MCTMVVVLYNLDENVLNQKKLFFEEKNGQGVLYISRFFWIYQKLKRNKKVTTFEVLFLVEIFKLDLNLKIEL